MKTLLLALFLGALAGPAIAQSAESIPWLLRPVGDGQASPAIPSGPHPVTSREAVRDASDACAAWPAGARRRVMLPSGEPVVVLVEQARPTADGVGLARGRIEGEAGSEVFMADVGGNLAGTVRRASGRMVVIQPLGGGRHRVRETESETAPRCGNDDGAAGSAAGRPRLATQERLAQPSGAGDTAATNVLDVLFVHTAAAEAGAGGNAGLRALVALAVVEANDAYARSGARVLLRTVGILPVSYAESGDAGTDLTRLSAPGDGWMDEVHRKRDELAADVVCLLIEAESTYTLAGMANQLRDTSTASIERGFLVCLRPYLIGNYTLPHEVGHTLGCDHDRENSGGGLQAWSYGTRITVEGESYRTVMAYRPGRQFPHFSNPKVLYRGVPTGSEGATPADNVRTLNFAAPLVAGAREPSRRVGFTFAAVSVPETAGTLRLALSRTGPLTPGSLRVLTVSGSARSGIDFEPLDLRVDLPEGIATVEVPLAVWDNAAADGPRRLAVQLLEPSEGLALGPVAALDITIVDDEEEGVALVDGSFRPQPGADLHVAALGLDGAGRILVGGGFATFNGEVRSRLARVLPDGGVDAGFAPTVKYAVNSVLALAEGGVAIAGDFNTVNAAVRNRVALLRNDGSLDPGFTFEPGADRRVNVVAKAKTDGFWIAGAFTTVQGVSALRVSRLRPNGTIDTSFDTRNGPGDEVRALLADARGGVVIGGEFAKVGSTARGRLARLDERGRLDASFAAGGGMDGPVGALTFDGEGRILVGGDFQRFDGTAAGRVVRLSAVGVRDAAFDPGLGPDGPVRALLARPDGTVWLAGDFTRVSGRPRQRVARLRADGSLDTAFDPGVGPNDRVLALAEGNQGTLYVGGVFTSVNGVVRGGIAALLPAAPAAPIFTGVKPAAPDFAWQAMAWPRQRYDVERSTDLRQWEPVETAQAGEDGAVAGSVRVRDSAAGFLRLHRRIE